MHQMIYEKKEVIKDEKVYVYVFCVVYVPWFCGWSYWLQRGGRLPACAGGEDNTASGGDYTPQGNFPRPGGKTAPGGTERKWRRLKMITDDN